MVAVDGEGLGKEIGRVKEGPEIRKNKHALGYPIAQPIPSKVHGLGVRRMIGRASFITSLANVRYANSLINCTLPMH